MYECPNGTDCSGWERKKHALPLVTGIYVHEGLANALQGSDPASAAAQAREAYLRDVSSRGLAVEAGADERAVIEEQAAHVEALVLAWCRVRLPRWKEEYEVIEVEKEDRVPLSDDVVLAVRADCVVRRLADGRMFVVNWKTVSDAGERWTKQWEVDMQLMTELLAAERRHGHEFGGVIIEGLIKGRRLPEKNNVGDVTGYRDSSPLLYGYKVDADPPLTSGEYGWEYTRKKGWYRFPAWKEQFPQAGQMSALSYWINWLPEEVVERQFITVPPIMRDEQRIESKVRQIVNMERYIHEAKDSLRLGEDLDDLFPQSEGYNCAYCGAKDLCFTANVAEDPAGSGLYVPRKDHHDSATSD